MFVEGRKEGLGANLSPRPSQGEGRGGASSVLLGTTRGQRAAPGLRLEACQGPSRRPHGRVKLWVGGHSCGWEGSREGCVQFLGTELLAGDAFNLAQVWHGVGGGD